MFRPMRRASQRLTDEECRAILQRNTSGVLAVLGEGGYPYAVPLSYVLDGDALYFHCAKSGHKLDAIASCDKVSFCVVDCDRVVPSHYTTHYRSVILFGRARVVGEEGEKRAAIRKLALKYHPTGAEADREEAIEREYAALCLVKITIEHLSGKEAIELAKANKRSGERNE